MFEPGVKTPAEIIDLTEDMSADSDSDSDDDLMLLAMLPKTSPAHEAQFSALVANRRTIAQNAPRELPSAPIFGQANSFLWKCDVLVDNYLKIIFRVNDWNEIGDLTDILHYLEKDEVKEARVVTEIKFIKSLEKFRELHVEDQEKLIKGAWIEGFFVRVLMQLDDSGDVMIKTDNKGQKKSFPLQVVLFSKDFESAQPLYQLIKSWPPDWRQDMRLMLIIYVIMLFSPGRAARDDIVKTTQDGYYKMLLHYLIFLYQNTTEAELAFTELNGLMNQLRQIAATAKQEVAMLKNKQSQLRGLQDLGKRILESDILKEILQIDE